MIILNIFLLFIIATDLLLVIVNSCLERHLPRGLLFVIANSTSILHACCKIDVLLAITNSNPCGKCLSRQLFTITNSKSVAIKKQKYVKNNQ
jgi:hypothetical protein